MNLTYISSAVTLIIILLIQCYYSYGACPSLISNETLTVTCKHNNKTLNNCNNPMDGTEAYIICNKFYEEDTFEANPKRLCREGRWDSPIPQCYPICGKMRTKESSNTDEDQDTLIDYPWHVGIYDFNKKFLCGGTLIAMNIVFTAAHCVTVDDVDNAIIEPALTYYVASGKYYFAYDDNRDNKYVQNSKVQEVHYPEEYKGHKNNLAFDIAILVLAGSFLPTEVVQPVCLNFQSSDNSLLQDSGLVIGWGFTYQSKQISEILEVVTVSYIPYSQCYSKINSNYAAYITFDKICGRYLDNSNGVNQLDYAWKKKQNDFQLLNNLTANSRCLFVYRPKHVFNKKSTLCNRDSGGGLVLKNKINDRYYITGILSSSPGTTNFICDPEQYSLYTSIYQQQGFLKNLTENIEIKNCQIPNHPSHGQYVFLDTNETLAYEFGRQVPTHSRLTLTCNVGYNFTSPGATQYYCSRDGQWKPALTGCTPIAFDQPTVLDKSKTFNYNYVILIISAIVIFVVLVAIILYKLKYKEEWELRREIKLAGLYRFHNGNLKRFNPELGIGGQAELLPYNNNFEFPREKLELGKQLGSGAFGIVIQADAFGIIPNEERTTVAVKMVKNVTDNIHIKALISELKIMVHLGQHLNVVNLLGACTKNITKRELLVIVEYCKFGNLYNYLLLNRDNYVNQIDSSTGNIDYSLGTEDLADFSAVSNNKSITNSEHNSPKPICTKDLISWSFQIARGMEYLACRKILHGDLAARNILLTDNNIVKICDFGLAKIMFQSLNYKKKQDSPLPIKWMAIESIRDRVFSTQSDVWSFGIVLWEFFSLAQTPYPGMEADERLYYKLLDGYKMESPQYAPKEMYKIMCDCWSFNPASRPCFNELAGRVGLMLEENVRQHYIDSNDPYFIMNTRRLHNNQKDYLQMLNPSGVQQISIPDSYISTGVITNDQPVTSSENIYTTRTINPDMSKTANNQINGSLPSVPNEYLVVLST